MESAFGFRLLLIAVLYLSHCNAEEARNEVNDVGNGHSLGKRAPPSKDGFVCPAIYGRFANPKDCSQYYECQHSYSELYQCKHGQLYDEEQKHCRDRSHVKCSTNTQDFNFTCPDESGLYSDSRDCSRFFTCHSNRPNLHKCPGFTMYDVEGYCAASEYVNCADRGKGGDESKGKVAKEYIRCPQYRGTFAHPYDCSKFIVCNNFEAKVYQCRESEYFNRDFRTCLPADKVLCDYQKRPEENKFDCPSCEGIFSDSQDCSQFHVCDNGKSTLYKCPSGTLYDEEGYCAQAKSVDCGNRPIGKDIDDDGNKKGNFLCPSAWGTFSHPFDCSKYVVCSYGVPTVYGCTLGQYFHQQKKVCLPGDQVTCDFRIKPDESRFVCPTAYGMYPDPNDCSRFYNCDRFKPTLHQCPENKLYDPAGFCAAPEDVKCGQRPQIVTDIDNKFVCPFPTGLYPDPRDCSRFFDCRNSTPTLYKCPGNTLYDEQGGYCADPKFVKCGNRPGGIDEENKFVCPSPTGLFPDPRDCSQFYSCYNSKTTLWKCPEGYLYDDDGYCEKASYVKCGKRPGGIGDDKDKEKDDRYKDWNIKIKCPSMFGTFVHPYDCSKFIVCSYYIPTVFRCKPGDNFDREKMACLPEKEVNCDHIIDPFTTTTTTTTTTPAPTTTTTTPAPTTPYVKPNTPPPTPECDPDDTDCIFDKTKDVKKWYDCPARYHHHPHAGSRRLFIHCDNWHPYIKRCPEHTLYHPTLKVCVWGEE